MNLDNELRAEIAAAIQAVFGHAVEQLQLQPTNKEFEGSHTVVCFPLTKISKKGPEETARLLGQYLLETSAFVSKYNVVKGFLNLALSDATWIRVFTAVQATAHYGRSDPSGLEVMVEYSSPNTNKPLHLGHLRNNFLGYSVAEIYEAAGYNVHKVQIINDRGIHICKSMAAWMLFGQGETPESSGMKGDKLVGKYYVEFDRAYKAQVQELEQAGKSTPLAEKDAPIMKQAVDLLLKWEAKDPTTLALWKSMNGWVYKGFESTYRRMGVSFDKLYYESDTYLLGKDEVLRGLGSGIFFRKDDGSIWVDLDTEGFDQKVLLRADGTSVYMTQDIGTAILRFRDFPKIEGQVYTVGNEQEYHFKVLFLILEKLGYAWAKKCYHLSYGMVDLPSGKMKSREGTVVDADDLMEEMVVEANKQTQELGKTEEMTEAAIQDLSEIIGIGALKYFLLKVDPKKRMLFDPGESISLQGHTGPFIQYTHARIHGMLRKARERGIRVEDGGFENVSELVPEERDLIARLDQYPAKVLEAASEYSPAVVANYVYELAKDFNQFYQAIPVLNETDQAKLRFRIAFSVVVAGVLKSGMALLGIRVPERM
ncbi:MAG: arginine--tRNA ligase [Cytophagales bacterium]|nr:arginine--tRNA ligase [Cytophagales bacterium]